MNALTFRRFSYSPVFWLFLLCAGVSYSADSTDAPQLPAPTGPYGVARVSYDMVDRTRQETLGEKPGSPREVMVEVWYPTAPRLSSRQSTASYLPGFDAAKPKLSQDDISDLFRPASYTGTLPKTHTVENAPIAPGKDRFPMLLFSHGWGNPTFLYTAELEDIVSHGYIVVAVEHPYDTTFTQFPDGHIVFFAQEAFKSRYALRFAQRKCNHRNRLAKGIKRASDQLSHRLLALAVGKVEKNHNLLEDFPNIEVGAA